MRSVNWFNSLCDRCGWNRRNRNRRSPLQARTRRSFLEALEARMLLAVDFGDAPDTGAGTGAGNYNTLAADNGASHTIVPGLRMGATVDMDDGTLQNAAANADDAQQAVPDDEDGVTNPAVELAITYETQPTINVMATNTTGSVATLSGWIDYNHDGQFENASERAQVAVSSGTSGGIVTLTFPPVLGGFAGTTYARFRLSTDAAAENPVGAASDGEVEDYVATVTIPGIGAASSFTKIGHNIGGGPTLTNADLFGNSVATLGDLDGDGVGDIAVGARRDDTGGRNRGAVYVLFLNSSGTVKSFQKIAHPTVGGPTLSSRYFGSSVASLGDLDGDGTSDLAVGAVYDDDGKGAVYLLLMNSDGTAKASQRIAHQTGGGPTLDGAVNFGSSLSQLGDLDGDGVTDLAVGARDGGKEEGGTTGAVYVLFLNSNGTVKSSQLIGHQTGGGPTLANADRFGSAVSSLGDLDGDGISDLAVGAYRDDTGGSDRGAVHLLFMNSDGTVKNSQKITHQTGSGPTLADGDRFGLTVSSLGDLDGDGVSDLAVGAYQNGAGDYNRGAVHVLLMNANGTVKSSQKIADQTAGGPTLADRDNFAYVTSLGDLNGDGVVDLAVGARGDFAGGIFGGAVYVLFLTPADEDAPILTSFTRQIPATSPTGADTLIFRATFDEAVTNVDPADFAVNGTATATITNVSVVNAGTYDMTISGGNLSGFNGTVGLNLANGQNITDLAGNALPAGEPATDETYLVDNNPRTVTGQVINGGLTNRSAVSSLVMQFNQPVTVSSVTALNVFNHTTGLPVDISSATLQDNGTNAVAWNFTGVSLLDGYYTATLPATEAGLRATHSFLLHVLAGDSSGDAQVSFADFGDLAANFNTFNGPILGPGDLNGDGDVDFTDFGILAASFNNVLTTLDMDFGDVPESGTSFPTTLANNGARHIVGSGLYLGAGVDGEADGQPDAGASGDNNAGDDENGVTFAALRAGTNAAVAVIANVPGTALLNAWIDFNADGDWDDAGEQVFVDEALLGGVNTRNMTVAIPSTATAGPTFARFRVAGTAGHSYFGLASDGEVEDHQVTIVAAKNSARRFAAAAPFHLWPAEFAAQSSSPQTTIDGPPSDREGSVWNRVETTNTDIIDLAIAEVAATGLRPPDLDDNYSWLDKEPVDLVRDTVTDFGSLGRSRD